MLAPKTTLTREELYEKVWSTPMQKLAAEFGFSDRGLAKLCQRYQVPVPPRGYWARLQVGQSVERTPLPPATEDTGRTVTITADLTKPQRQRDIQGQEIPIITVAEDRPITHPVALLIKKSFARPTKSETGLISPSPLVAVPIRVSAEQFPRALRICGALLDSLEQTGCKVNWAPPFDAPVKVTVREEPLSFLVSEVLERREHKLTDSELVRQKRERWWQPEKWDYVPTGRLMLSIEYGDNLGVRRTWSDGKKRVEDILGHFVVSLGIIAKAVKQKREELAERQRRWNEEWKRREEEAVRRAAYERRAKAVESLARSWEQSKSLRAFAESLSNGAQQDNVSEEQKQELRTMAEWVAQHAGFVDPFNHLSWMIRQFKDAVPGHGN